jgi:hypothetical protein
MFMARFFPSGSILKYLFGSISIKTLIVAGCVLASAWAQPPARAQHVGGHVGGSGHVGGGVRMGALPRAPISRPPVFTGPRGFGPRPAGFGPRGFGFRAGRFGVFRRRVFFGAPFYRFGRGLGYASLWWPTCGPSLGWGWGWGYDCYPLPYYGYGFGGYGFENYAVPQVYESPAYFYGGEDRDLIWLYLKDGTGYAVTDYWVVNGQMHYSIFEDDPMKPAEHVVPLDELDLQKTIDVNTRRGFRMVFRNEPWQQYLKDHPDLTPPDLAPPQKN